MKNKIFAGLTLAMLTPLYAHSAPITWVTESYNVFSDLEVDIESPAQINTTVNSLAGLPLTYINSGANSSSTGNASVGLGIKNILNQNSNIYELKTDISTSYNGGINNPGIMIDHTQYSEVVTAVSLSNTFMAKTENLFVDFDFSTFINMSSSSAPSAKDRSASGILMEMYLVDTTDFLQRDANFIENYFITNNAGSNDPITKQFIGTDTYNFNNLIEGRTYTLALGITSDVFSSGTIANNSSNSILTVAFSDTAPVPEPETYAMLLVGLGLVGFSARRKQQI